MLLALLLSLIAGLLAVYGLAAFIIGRRILAAVDDFTRPGPDQDGKPTPSQLALTVQAIAAVLATELEQRISAMMMGKASAVSKAIDAIEGEAAEMQLSQSNPLLGALINFSPALKKKIARSPALGLALQGLSQGGLGSLFGKPAGNNHHEPARSQGKLGF